MQVLLSPSKTMNYKPVPDWVVPTTPTFIDKSRQLVDELNQRAENLAQELGVSHSIADLNRKRFAEWSGKLENGQPAIWAYSGDVYNGFAVSELDENDLQYAQAHVWILSGLYGAVRPFDAIEPYRLEMRTRLRGEWGDNLYEFWGDDIAQKITEPSEPIVVCASEEYAKAVRKYIPKSTDVITPHFLIATDGEPVQKSLFSKYSRGVFARWIVANEVEKTTNLADFDLEGYQFDETLSTPEAPVFVAPQDFSLAGRFTKS